MLSAAEIRLLDLLPSTESDDQRAPICIQTRVVPISGNTQFEALSYVWGKKNEAASIIVDELQITVTRSLHSALKRIRLSNTKRTLWIDQLSINQNDEKEKMNQIPLMGQIYSTTSRCLIWLGEPRPDIAHSDAVAALDILHFMASYEKDKTPSQAIPPCLASEMTIAAPLAALGSICVDENVWWHRIWTLQEAILPSRADILWGVLSISWDEIVRAGRNKPIPPLDRVAKAHRDVVNRLFTQINGIEYAKQKTEGPLETAFRWSFRQATNTHDKVYGFLGLFPKGTLKRAECCDYRLPLASLCAMFTADVVEHDRSLRPIAIWSRCGLPESTPNIPGWAFDIAVTTRQQPLFYKGEDVNWYLMHHYEWHSASAQSDIDWSQFQFDQKINSLTLTGCHIDQIAFIGDRLDSYSQGVDFVSDSSVCAQILKWYNMAKAFFSCQSESTKRHRWQDAFWRGLIDNVKSDEDLRPQHPATSYDVELLKEFVYTGKRTSSTLEAMATLSHRVMFITGMGMLGFGPRYLAAQDEVWILHGGKVPFVLRPQTATEFQCIGASYVHGIMNGEALSRTDIRLVVLR
ncbi:heterokaryon incompatibility protein [Fusarium subglutinans]|uniref:Heterokaryon incompatibility protein n=1 Tax=Gibberella subglutinans TaxID=42677 RepID=A0A8H5L472_GIBSU|nr:heterokaryon incompatibility protein [Fusarium subglutinans]KAF5584462.1 heterokaryon incompatibility protein [Fusarium subglutinans]